MYRKTMFGFAILALIFASGWKAAGQDSPAFSPTYTWYGELVSADTTANTISVKARLVSDAPEQVMTLTAGQQVLMHWSGFDTSANAVRGVSADTASAAATDRFLFPAELVSPDVDHDYATFRFHAPAEAVAAAKSLEPGTWITVTAKQKPMSVGEAVVSLEPYSTEPAA